MIPKDKVILADGAMGTELMKLGYKPGTSSAEWNITKPDAVRKVLQSYRDAGSGLILSNTFGASRFQLAQYGLEKKAREISRAGAALVREVCEGGAIPAGDMGPSGKLFLMGEISEAELFDGFSEQADALKEGGAQWLAIETMTDVGEMEVACRAASATGLPVIASMTYEKKTEDGPGAGTGYRTVMGHTPEEAVRAAENAGASAVGANCGYGIDCYAGLVPVLRALTSLPIFIKGNAGIPEMKDGRLFYPMGADEFAAFIPGIVKAGATIVGGCCGTSPEYIRKIKAIRCLAPFWKKCG